MSLELRQSWQQVGLLDRPLMHFTGTLADNLLSARPAGHLPPAACVCDPLKYTKDVPVVPGGHVKSINSKGYVHNLPTAPGLLCEGWTLPSRPSRIIISIDTSCFYDLLWG